MLNGSRAARNPTVVSVVYSVAGVLPLFLVSSQAVRLQHDLGFDRASLGLAVSLCFVASALAATPLGHLVQRIGPSTGLKVSATFSLCSLVWMAAVASQWWHVVVGLALCGLANATAQVSTNQVLADRVAVERQGVAFGTKQAAVPVASLIAGLMLPLIVLLAGWRAAFAGAACVVVVAVLARPHVSTSGGRAGRGPGRPTPVLVMIGLVGVLAGGVGNALPAFTVDSAVSQGIDESAAGLILALGGGMAVLGRIGVGWIADRRRSRGLAELAALTGGGIASMLALALSGGSHAVFVIALLAGFATAWGWPGLIYYATVRTHPAMPAAATGLVLSCVYVGNILGPVGVGLLAQHGSYGHAWTVAAGMMALATAAALAAVRLERRRAAAAQPARLPVAS